MFEPLLGFTDPNCTGQTDTDRLFLHENPQFLISAVLSACGWAAGWGTDKAANWLCRQMIAGNAANQGEATFKSIERLRCTPSRAGGAPKGPNSG